MRDFVGLVGLLSVSMLLLLTSYSPGIIAGLVGACPGPIPTSSIQIFRLKRAIPGATRTVKHISIVSPNATAGYQCGRIIRLTRRTINGTNKGNFTVA